MCERSCERERRVNCVQLVFCGRATNQRAKEMIRRPFLAAIVERTIVHMQLLCTKHVSSARLCYGVKTIQAVCQTIHPITENLNGNAKEKNENMPTIYAFSTTQTCVQLT